MRVTRYLWISNLPQSTSEENIRNALQSYGKIQSVRIHSGGTSNGAVVAFMDTQSATRAIQDTIWLDKTALSMQYCESSGNPGSISQDTTNSNDSFKTDCSSLTSPEYKKPESQRRFPSDVDGSISPENSSERRKPACSYPRGSRYTMNATDSATTVASRHSKQRGLRLGHLPLRSSDANLREGLFHEYKKHGKISSVVVRGHGEERYCIMTFKRSEDAIRALESSRGKVFFGTPITASLHDGLDVEDPDLCPPEHALDEYHPKATKTLFVGNLCSSTVTQDELRRTFRSYGEILEIDIKIQANQPDTSYAFVQYSDIKSVVRALSNQETIRVGGKCVKLGFGKSQPTNVVWLDHLPTVTEEFLTRQFGRYGHLSHVVLDRKSSKALLYFDTVEMAQRALNETRNRAILGRKVQLDFAGYECQVSFMRRLGKNDGFGQAYDDYRERLTELLSLWPCGLPLLGRNKLYDDNPDSPGSRFSPVYDRRPSKKRLSSTDNDSPSLRRRSDKSRGPVSSEERHRRPERTRSRDASSSPISDFHSKTDMFVERHRGCSSSKTHGSHYRSGLSTDRLLSASQSASGTGKSRSRRVPDTVSQRKNTSYRSVPTRSFGKSSHYLDEADDVSSDSLSSDSTDLNAVDFARENVSLPHDKLPQQSNSSSILLASPSQKSQDSSPVPKDKHYKKHRLTDSSRPETQTTKDRSTSGLMCPGKPIHSHTVPSDSSNLPCTVALHDTIGLDARRRSKPTDEDDAYIQRPLQASQTGDPRSIEKFNSSLSGNSRKAEDRKWKLSPLHIPESNSLSQDTLTKLEQERAKLLRELSLLNNEVGGNRSKVSLTPTKQRGTFDRGLNVSHEAENGPANQTKLQVASELLNTRIYSASPGECNKFHGINRPTDCRDSSGELGEMISPAASGCADPLLTSYPVPGSQEIQSVKHIPQPRVATVTQRPVNISCTPSIPDSNPVPKFSPASPIPISPDSSAFTLNKDLKSMTPANSDRNLPTSRAHHTSCMVNDTLDLEVDIPPPPPPIPDNFKTALWVDTSRTLSSSASTKALVPPVASKMLISVAHSLAHSTSEIYSRPSTCSLDERIRLLDAQLLKSEKARPTIDYSKFRIKRKADPNASSGPSCTTTYSEQGGTPTTHPSPVATAQELPIPQLDRVCPDLSFPATTSSTIAGCSPISAVSTSPVSLARPADTSDFVKSMLSSKLSPPAVSDSFLVLPSVDITSTRTVPVRSTGTVTSGSDTISRNLSHVLSAQSPLSNGVTRRLGVFDSQSRSCYGSHGSLGGVQPIGVATRMPFAPSSPKRSASDKPIPSSTPEVSMKPVSRKDTSPSLVDYHVHDPFPGTTDSVGKLMSTDTKPNVKRVSKQPSTDYVEKSLERHQTKTQVCVPDESAAEVTSPTLNKKELNSQNRIKPKSKDDKRPSSVKSTVPRPTLDDSIFSDLKSFTGKNSKRRHSILESSDLPVSKKPKSKISNLASSNPDDIRVPKRATKTDEPDEVRTANKVNLVNKRRKRLLSESASPDAKPLSRKVTSSQPDGSTVRPDVVRRKKKSVTSMKSNVTALSSLSNEMGYESMYDKIKRRASKDTKTCDSTMKSKNPESVNSKSSSKHQLKGKRVGSRTLLEDSDTDECLSDDSGMPGKTGTTRQVCENRKSADVLDVKNRTMSSSSVEPSSPKSSTEVKQIGSKNHRSLTNAGAQMPSKGKLSKRSSAPRSQHKDRINSHQVEKPIGRKRLKKLSPSVAELSRPSKCKKTSGRQNVSVKERRSLVRRVFASTDSDSFSSLSSDMENTDDHINSKVSSHCSGSTTHASRSCSPDDLGADAAVRHTFGAFTFPPGRASSTEKRRPSTTEESKANQARVKNPTDPVVTGSAPPSLPKMYSVSCGDKSPSSSGKHLRESSDWNIFTALANRSVPKQNNLISVKSNASDLLPESSVAVFDDELPALEKHDSIESDSVPVERIDSSKSKGSDSDDLPPPVVSALGDLSPLSTVDCAPASSQMERAQQPDIIEEVVYDALELQLPVNEKNDATGYLDSAQSLVLKPESPPTDCGADQESQNNNASINGSAKDARIAQDSLPTSRPLSSQPFPSLSVASPVFTPITVLAPSQQPGNFTGMGHPLLVTVPRSGSSASLTPTGLTILPAAFNPVNTAKGPVAANQRHLTLLLPAAPVSSLLSVRNNPTVSIPNAPAIVYNAPVLTTASSVCVLSPAPVNSLLVHRGDQETSVIDKTGASPAAKLPTDTSSTVVTSISLESQTHVLNSLPTSPSVITCAALGSSDFTSYVQRVIERVKQEKDVEVSLQKEKVKRSKRVSILSASAPIVSAALSSAYSSASSTTVSPSLSTVTPILPCTVLASNTKSPVNTLVDTRVQATVVSSQIGTPVVLKPDPGAKSPAATELQDAAVSVGYSVPAIDDATVLQDATASNFSEKQGARELTSASSVDDVIDAVLGAHFDKADIEESDTVVTSYDVNARSPHTSEVARSPVPTTSSKAASENITDPPAITQSQLESVQDGGLNVGTTNVEEVVAHSAELMTPMGVLSLMAANVVAVPQPASTLLTKPTEGTSERSINPVVPVIRSSLNKPMDPNALELPITTDPPAVGEALTPSASVATTSQIEQLAAQFASYPLTNYFYSLLAQHRLQPTTSDVSSNTFGGEGLNRTSPITVQSRRSTASVIPGSNGTADFLTAVATMAAMNSSVGQPNPHEPLINTVLSSSPQAFPTTPWTTPHLDVKGFPVAWQGRLSLKNDEIFVQFHYVSGSRDLLKDCMDSARDPSSSSEPQLLKIVQRMRLEPSQLNGVYRKLHQTNDFCMCLTLATAHPLTIESSASDERGRMNHVLQEVFIKYLVEKCAAGIINVCHPCTQQNLYVIHIFPPCDFSRHQLETTAPVLLANLSKCGTPYLLIIITTV